MTTVLGLCCSARHLGNCEVLVREALKGAGEVGANVEFLRLTDLHFEPCRGCLACVYKGKCAIKNDGLQTLLEKILFADGLIVAAPTYLLGPAGIVKLVADRALNLAPHLETLTGRARKGATISVAGNAAWNPLGVELLNLFTLAFGYEVIDYLEAYAPGPGEVLLNPDNARGARELGRRVALAIQGRAARRSPAPDQCPHCYSRLFRLAAGGRAACAVCLTTGKLEHRGGETVFLPDPPGPHGHFWSPAYRQKHLADWIVPSRDRYLARRAEIKELLARHREGWPG